MNFLISDAWAQAEGQAGSGLIEFIVMIVIFFAIMYFLIIRPQSKRAKEHKAMVDALGKGDEVVTNGGLLGKVTELDDAFIKIEVAEGTVVSIQRHAVAAVMPKGTMKAL
ncbi:preprotein translocase subunit YajC [Thiorhodospira sibirica]|uniref:preprotein translocase subunit YajC n=1 Tax=Thiorhodospira sibirica TaxID=154347 RepID=UPI00022C585D|nr:preprotein translocase subunit YajC [Thiorhodospira sibirica]